MKCDRFRRSNSCVSAGHALALETRYGRHAVVDALRAEAAALRERARSDARRRRRDTRTIERQPSTSAATRDATAPSLRRVINATGVIVHTNLGRAPLAATQRPESPGSPPATRISSTTSDRGKRGRRDTHAERCCAASPGPKPRSSSTTTPRRPCSCWPRLPRAARSSSRAGELVEIGGGFRVPDVLAQSGAILREVGTTNRTRAADYAAAINDRTALILRVHPSNFRIKGSPSDRRSRSWSTLGHRFGMPVVEDIGSGYLGSADRASSPVA